MTDDQKNQNLNPEPVTRPFQGSEGLIKNLTSTPDSNQDRESLLDQVVDTPQESQSAQPAQSQQGGKDDTK